MKIAIVGAGAMGSVYAGLLADAGHAVWGACRAHLSRPRPNLRWQDEGLGRVLRLAFRLRRALGIPAP